jgi:two-component system, LytTR family, response regulator
MSEPIRAIIVDDEPVARDLLALMLAEADVGRTMSVVAECGNADEAVAAIREHEPDVVFLDVQMPGGDGFSVVEAVGVENMPAIVFVTAYDEYALKAFDVVAVDYLLKPFDDIRLERTLKRLFAHLQQQRGAVDPRLEALLQELRSRSAHATRIAVDAGSHMSFVSTSNVDRIEAKGRHSIVHSGDLSYVAREGLTDLASRLDPKEFIRVHRSHVIRIDRIKEVHRWFRGDYYLVLMDGTKLTSGGTYKRMIEEVLMGGQRPPP